MSNVASINNCGQSKYMKILFGELIGVFENQSGHKVTMVHAIEEGKIVWSGRRL